MGLVTASNHGVSLQIALNLDPFMIHETFLCLTETAFGSHPCRIVSVTYRKLRPFHRGSNARDRDYLSIGNLVTASAFELSRWRGGRYRVVGPSIVAGVRF